MPLSIHLQEVMNVMDSQSHEVKPGRDLPPSLRRLIESWVEAHGLELLEQWHNAQSGEQVEIVG